MHAKVDGEIKYLFDAPPDAGKVRQLLPGLKWFRVPLPFVLNHVNCWLLDDGGRGDTVTLIDTGADKPQTRALWDDVLSGTLEGRKISRLICTHGHPDHIGLAGWLCDKLDVPLHMTLAEWLAPQVWMHEGQRAMSPATRAFFADHGLSDAAIKKIHAARETTPPHTSPLPTSFVRMRDNEVVTFGGQKWKVLVNGGHADEHASFYCKQTNVLIAGDQILSRISPVVGVFPSQPLAEPLSDYLASLKRLRKLPADTIVLPSHGLPFRGLHTRIDQLAHHHADRLDALSGHMKMPANTFELAHGLFAKAMATEGQTVMAMAETLAHAHHLVATKRARKIVADDGAITFQKT